MNFSVGQLVYLLTRKDPKVYPALVSEEIKKKSLEGESTSYMIRLPTDEAREVELDKLDAEVFTSISQAREKMVERATSQIDLILEKAESISSIFSDLVKHTREDTGVHEHSAEYDIEQNSSDEYATVDLGDGKVGRIDVSNIKKLKEAVQ